MKTIILLHLATLFTALCAQDFPLAQTHRELRQELDWELLTEENGWGFFIAPLQDAYSHHLASGDPYVPFLTPAVQNTLQLLCALRGMQSSLGGVYDAPVGTLGSQDNPYEISVKNNFSSLAGLMIFQQILQEELKNETDLLAEQKQHIQTALSDIDIMINGGATPQGTQTQGLISFFKNTAWDKDNEIFYQRGDGNNPTLPSDWVPTSGSKAVDVNTWGVSVLGQPLLDSWYGFGTCYDIWQNVKSWGGFFELDTDGNTPQGGYPKGGISIESAAGATNMLRCLIAQYHNAITTAPCPCEQEEAARYVQELQDDHDTLLKNLILFANPPPNGALTSWAILLHDQFNPFKAGGDYTPYSFD